MYVFQVFNLTNFSIWGYVQNAGQIAVFGEMFKSPPPPPLPNRKKIIKFSVLNTDRVSKTDSRGTLNRLLLRTTLRLKEPRKARQKYHRFCMWLLPWITVYQSSCMHSTCQNAHQETIRGTIKSDWYTAATRHGITTWRWVWRATKFRNATGFTNEAGLAHIIVK